MFRYKTFLRAACWSFCIISLSCKSEDPLPPDIITLIENKFEGKRGIGISVGVIEKNQIEYFNYGNLSVDGPTVDEHTVYEIGSISKVFTATLLANQVIQGELQLNDPINKFLPDRVKVPVQGSKNEITFGNLSDHTSGLPRMPNNHNPSNPKNPMADYSVEQMYSFISSYRPTRRVGTEFEYSNLAVGLLGHVLALYSKLSYEQLMIRDIASPLKMYETKIVLDEDMNNRLAIGYRNGIEVGSTDLPTIAGAGAIRSTTADMLKFLSANIRPTSTSLKDPIQLTQKVRHDKADDMRVGLGWFIAKGTTGDIIWHTGGTAGYKAFAGFVKELDKGVVVLTNSTTHIQDIGFLLLDPLYDQRHNAIKIAREKLVRYEGIYKLKSSSTIEITREGGLLYGRATGQERFALVPINDNEFYWMGVEDVKIKFDVTGHKVENLTLYLKGDEIQGTRID